MTDNSHDVLMDVVFDKLKRSQFRTVESELIQKKGAIQINPYVFEIVVRDEYHCIVEKHGWTVEEFTDQLNYKKYT